MSETPTDQQLAEWEAAAVRDEMLGRAPKWALAALRALREARDRAEGLLAIHDSDMVRASAALNDVAAERDAAGAAVSRVEALCAEAQCEWAELSPDERAEAPILLAPEVLAAIAGEWAPSEEYLEWLRAGRPDAAPTGQEEPSGLGQRLEWARNGGRAHERHYPGHTMSELDESDYTVTAVRMVCDACDWTVAAGGPRDPSPSLPVHLIEEGKQ